VKFSLVWIEADKVKLESVLRDRGCQSYMLALIAEAWRRLVHDQKRQFSTTTLAKKRLEAYFQASRSNQNTALAFYDQRLRIRAGTHIPKVVLYKAYEDWFSSEQDKQGFAINQKKTKQAFLETIAKTTDHIHSVKECERRTWVEGTLGIESKRSTRCFTGIGFHDSLSAFLHDTAYVGIEDDDEDATQQAMHLALHTNDTYKKNNWTFKTPEGLLVQSYYRLCDPLDTTITLQGNQLHGISLVAPLLEPEPAE
jgi:hypothetical protein